MTYPKSITISVAKNEDANGAALLAMYAQAKTLTPNGAALSATNRVTIWLPPGRYKLPNTLTLDTSFVDIKAMDPIETGWRGPTTSLTQPTGYSTVVTCAGGGKPTVVQTANDIRLFGFVISNTGTTTGSLMSNSDCGLVVKCGTNGAANVSFYRGMVFVANMSHSTGASPAGRLGCTGETGYSISGTWVECVCGAGGWRLSHTATKSTAPKLSGKFYRCYAGARGFGGDIGWTATQQPGITGYFWECASGNEGFGGCSAGGTVIESTAELHHCVAGTDSYAMGSLFDGTAYYCIGGARSFAGHGVTWSSDWIYSGQIGPNAVLVGCRVAGSGFATLGRKCPYLDNTWTFNYGGVRGKLINCIAEALTVPIALNGGTIVGGTFKTVTENDSPITLIGAGGQITGAKIIANGTGKALVTTGKGIFSGSSGSHSPAGNRFYSGDAIDTITYPTPLLAGSISIAYKIGGVDKTITDDGEGALIGDVGAGTNTINYETGAVDVTLAGVCDSSIYMTTEFQLDLTAEANRPKLANCSMNADLDTTITNGITTPYNVVDSLIG